MIRIVVLGAGSALPTLTHSAAGYWVTVDETSFLVDPGPGALIRLVRAEYGPDSLDAIDRVLFTHLHVDHCADLVPLLFALHSPLPESTRPLDLFGPRGLAAYLGKLKDIYGTWLDPARRELRLTEIRAGDGLKGPGAGEGRWRVVGPGNPATVTTFTASHPQARFTEECLGLGFEDRDGNRLVYSGDTGPCAGLEEASRGADLLVVECSTPDELATEGHMTPGRVADLCAAAAPRRVVLTHQYPPAAALDLPSLIARRFTGPVVAATDGMVFELPGPEPGDGTES
jgi:ribonuclease BN (tRNA processing enzyme)